MKFISYLIHYKENTNELEELTKKYDDERTDNYKANKTIQELNKKIKFLNERVEKHLETIKKKNKQIKELKKSDKEV